MGNGWRALGETVHVLALAIWLGFVVASGAFAAAVFPIARRLDPSLPDFQGFDGEHWRIVGGQIAQTVFAIVDFVQFACALTATVTMVTGLWALGARAKRPATAVRSLALAVGLGGVASLLLVVNPKIYAASRLYWAAAKAGDNDAALAHRAIVDATHPYAEGLMTLTAVCVLIALVGAAWSLASPRIGGAAGVEARPRYEEPALLRKGRT